jgi:hypothetical protein
VFSMLCSNDGRTAPGEDATAAYQVSLGLATGRSES